MKMKEISLDERKEIELEILLYVTRLCEKNRIEYSLCGGSLIGAIRHGGFIPWDDDIDIFLTRENYKKLIDLLKDDLHYKLYAPETTENYLYGFCKLMDKRTVIYSEYDEEIGTPELGVFIDIYPVDLIPENKKEQRSFLRKLDFYLHCAYAASNTMYAYGNTKLKHWIKKIVLFTKHLICRRKGTRYWMKKTEKIASEYLGTNAKLRGSVYSRYGSKEILPRKIYENTIEVSFEGYKIKIIKQYDKFLKRVYGDYMKLPPKEKQVLPHEYDAFWRE